MPSPAEPSPDPRRFEVSKATLVFDRLMSWIICFGGITVILAVIAIFFFIAKVAVPLFQSADVEELGQSQLDSVPLVIGVDEWGQMPFLYQGGAEVVFLNMDDGKHTTIQLPGLEGEKITCYDYNRVHQRVAFGLEDGRVGSFRVEYETEHSEDLTRKWLVPKLIPEPIYQVEHGEGPVTAVSYGDAESIRMIAVMRGEGESASVSALKLQFKTDMLGRGKLKLAGESELTSSLSGMPRMVRASNNGTMILVVSDKGEIDYFHRDMLELSKKQTFQPFEGGVPRQLDLLHGGVSMIITSQQGQQQQWSLFRKTEDGPILFGMVRDFPELPEGPVVYTLSLRNRSFLIGAGNYLSIRYTTTGEVRWEKELDYQPVAAVIDDKNRFIYVADDDEQLHVYALDDPHPEANLNTLFGKVWYEGVGEPVYRWQSTGGSSDFEPKFSLMPLIFGSIKGTFYALLFSIPVALLAAVFSAAFLPLSVKRVVKPMMEIMASLPSVVLGFLAAFWLAPALKTRVPSVLLMILMVPVGVWLIGYLWSRLPVSIRNRFDGGQEWMLVLPVMALFGWFGWAMGPVIESWFFVYTDPDTGKKIADFTMWWDQATGLDFEERNSMVLGFIMGFAVIPVIFTISEDALSNVPKSLTAASSALGANRWQVVWTIMLPVASSGIFSALMIGFGRAVGETMIILMAGGNTAVLEWNIFNGMSTLASNIAFEFSEAAENSTHYRILFLSAVVLFLLTSVMNTIAEVLRQRLRERNKIV